MILGFRIRWAIGLVVALFMVSCTAGASDPSDSVATTPAEPVAPAELAVTPAPTGLAQLQGTATVEFVVNGESVVVEVDGTQAPITAGNFVDLV